MTAQEFNTNYYTPRLGTDSAKWDGLEVVFGAPTAIPMWVADMDFKTPAAVKTALDERSDHGVFGYTFTPESYYEAVQDWHLRRLGVKLEKDWMRSTAGVVCALHRLINLFTQPGDAVLIQTPVYHQFLHVLEKTERTPICSELVNTDGVYTIDFERFEQDVKEHNVKAFILCSPHNPVGRVWTEEELDTMFDICQRHGVLILSDEIHQDLIVGERAQVPAFKVANGKYMDSIIAMTSASKTFNLAGLFHANVHIPQQARREAYDEWEKRWGLGHPNLMSVLATEAAYRGGEEWLEGLLALLRENYRVMTGILADAAPGVVVSPLEGTYLSWLDLSAYPQSEDLPDLMLKRSNIACNYGKEFSTLTPRHIRLNLATSTENVTTAINKLAAALGQHRTETA